LQNSPLEGSCVVVALIENYSTSKPLNLSPEKSQILSCDTVVANERCENGVELNRILLKQPVIRDETEELI
jgi:hypothetical protein